MATTVQASDDLASVRAGAPRYPRWVTMAFVGNLLSQMGIVLTGGLVRLTGSGLGCDTWPQCTPGSFVPTVEQQLGIHPYIEFGNRLLTFVLTVFAALVVLAAVRHLRHKGRGFRRLAMVPLALTIVQAIWGGILVLTHLHANLLVPHYLLSAVLIAVSTVLLDRLRQGDGEPRRRYPAAMHHLFTAIAVVGTAVVILGTLVTGSGPHSGDARVEDRLPFDTRTISWLHADVVMLFVGLTIGFWIASRLVHTTLQTRRAADAVVLVTAAQGLVGYVQYYAGLPAGLVALHMLLSTVFIWSIAHLGTTLLDRGAHAVATRPDSSRPAQPAG